MIKHTHEIHNMIALVFTIHLILNGWKLWQTGFFLRLRFNIIVIMIVFLVSCVGRLENSLNDVNETNERRHIYYNNNNNNNNIHKTKDYVNGDNVLETT